MNAELIRSDDGQYIKLSCGDVPITTENDVLVMLGACGDHQSSNLFIAEDCLHSDFYDLKTGLAGLLFHKLSTYRIKTAFVGRWNRIQSIRFRELMNECNRGDQTRFFTDGIEAERWLLA